MMSRIKALSQSVTHLNKASKITERNRARAAEQRRIYPDFPVRFSIYGLTYA